MRKAQLLAAITLMSCLLTLGTSATTNRAKAVMQSPPCFALTVGVTPSTASTVYSEGDLVATITNSCSTRQKADDLNITVSQASSGFSLVLFDAQHVWVEPGTKGLQIPFSTSFRINNIAQLGVFDFTASVTPNSGITVAATTSMTITP